MRPHSTPQRPDYWLRRNQSLSALLDESNRLSVLTQTLRQHLDPTIAPHIQLSQADPSAIVLMTDSAVWAARLRFHRREIQSILYQHAGLASHRVDVRVSPPELTLTADRQTRRSLSQATADQLLRTANQLSRDAPAISDVLRRLAAHRHQS